MEGKLGEPVYPPDATAKHETSREPQTIRSLGRHWMLSSVTDAHGLQSVSDIGRSREVKVVGALAGRFAGLTAFAALLVLLSGCSFGGGTAGGAEAGEGQDASPRTAESAAPEDSTDGWPAAEVAAEVEPSVVQVNVEGVRTTPLGPRESQGLGSGVIYREDGYIITNAHVVEGAEEVTIAFADGTTERGRVAGADRFTDLAVVEVGREGLPAAEFAESGGLASGQLAVAIGSPSGFQSTVTAGVISGLNREIPSQLTGGAQAALVDLVQTDAAISPGSSGGALANAAGEVVGVNVAYLPPGQTGAVNLGFAIPSDTATSVADQLIEDGEAEHPYLGLSLTSLTPRISERFGFEPERGALVTGVDPEGPSAGTGVDNGVVITAADGREIEGAEDLLSVLRDYRPGDELRLTLLKDSERREIPIELGEREQ